MFRTILTVFLCAATTFSFSQSVSGYWDKDRATTKEVKLGPGERIFVKSEDFPVGTTELAFRITLLNENQQLANNLVSVLKVIPDPSGYSQGGAGALAILSSVSGTDNCTYAIFSDAKEAANYQKTAKTDKACLAQPKPLSKDAKVISLKNYKCLTANGQNLWFGFQSENKLLNEKIILEIVPWVDKKLSTGWSLENRKTILANVKSTANARLLKNSDNYSFCVLEKIKAKHSFQEYKNLMAAEKNNLIEKFGRLCLVETGDAKVIDNYYRTEAGELIKEEKYEEAIRMLNTNIVAASKTKVSDYNMLGYCYLFTRQYEKAIKQLLAAEQLDDSELTVKLNLAHAYLLSGNPAESREIHKKFRKQNIDAKISWAEQTKNDFEIFQKAGLPSDNFKKILKFIAD